MVNNVFEGGLEKELLREYTKKPVPEVVTRETIYNLGNKFNDKPIVKALFYFIYLTGARVTEALAVKREDIQMEYYEGEATILIKLRNLKKRRGAKVRIIPILIGDNHPIERDMFNIIAPYIKRVENGDIWIFPGDLQSIRKRIHSYLHKIELTVPAVHNMKFIDVYTFKLYPHYLRHCRLTHLAQLYEKMNDLRLMKFAGWSSTKQASVYIHFNWFDLASAMKE